MVPLPALARLPLAVTELRFRALSPAESVNFVFAFVPFSVMLLAKAPFPSVVTSPPTLPNALICKVDTCPADPSTM